MTAGAIASRTRAAIGQAAREARTSWRLPATAAVTGVALAALLPLVVRDPVSLQDLAAWLYLALAAVGLAFALGLAGMPSLCQGAFMALGAFAAALLRARAGAGAVEAALAGLALTTLVGAALGVGFVRLGRVPFAVATWLFAWLVALGLTAFPSVSGGAQGIAVPRGMSETAHYELALALVVLATLALFAVARGAPGFALSALRQRRAAALTLGVRATRLRLGAFVASAGIGGLAGAWAVQLQGIADPTGYGPFLSFKLFVAVLLGGMTSAVGAIAGLGALSGISQLSHWIGDLENLSTARFDPMLFAILVLIVLGLGGAGLVPWLRRLLEPFMPAPATPPVRAASRPATAGAVVAAEGLRKRFGGVVALDGLDLEARPETIVALIGPNGSGKTTALRALSGTLTPDAGRVALDGRPVGPAPLADRVRLGIVRTLQRTAVFEDMTALENVLVGGAVRRRYGGAVRTVLATPLSRAEAEEQQAEARAILELLGLGAAADAPARTLSASDQRLLMLAAALATRPRVLLLDEIAAGGTAADVRRLATVLDDLRRSGLAIVLVEHNLRLVRDVASTVVVLDHGRPIAVGPPDAVATLPQVQEAYLGRHRL